MILSSIVSISAASDTPGTVRLGWNPNPESDIAGYRVHYGTVSGRLTASLSVGATPKATLSGLEPATVYYCAVLAVNSTNLAGPLSAEIAFVTPAAPVPEISVERATGSVLTDGQDRVDFNPVNLGSTGEAETFVIKNTGTADLTNLAIFADGTGSGDFILGSPTVPILAPGASTTFTLTFKPTVSGLRAATLHITRNDADENPFEITLAGTGVGSPRLPITHADGTNLTGAPATTDLGTVNLSGTGLAAPNIIVIQNDGTPLTRDGSSVSFGNCNFDSTTASRIFTIKNSGTATVSGISVTNDGSDFNVGNLGSTSLPPGASTTFKVSFQPNTVGARTAQLWIASNDAAEGLFAIALTGNGVDVPDIVVENGGKSLVDDNAYINFGTLDVGSSGKSQIFTVRNVGGVKLEAMALTRNGLHAADFTISSALRTRSLAPGASTTFKITFKPGKIGTRWAAIHIASNDPDESSFDIVLTGNGKKAGSLATTSGISDKTALPTTRPVKGIEVINGRKYRTLTIAKTPGTTVLPRDVEVSSDLVAWSSGKRHTTVLLDNAKFLKVCDNTPITHDAKRYIRLKR